MRTGIVGSGMIGATTARLFVAAGHEVAIANSRGPSSLGTLVEEIGGGAQAATVDEAARFGDVVLLAVPLKAYADLPLATEGRPGALREERLALFVAGDDAKAKEVVAGIIEQLGFAAVDTGSLAEGGRSQQPGSPVYNTPMGPERAEACVAEGTA